MGQVQVVQVDTLIIGAGMIGSSVAMNLARMDASLGKEIRVVDLDMEGSLSSSELNAGGVRATFVQELNIAASVESINYFASVADEVGYKDCGYLWLHTPEKLAVALRARETQLKYGWQVDEIATSDIHKRWPFIDKTDDVAGATFGVKDGLLNPNLLKKHFRDQARRNGVQFDDRTIVRSAEYLQTSDRKVRVVTHQYSKQLSWDIKHALLSAKQLGEIEYSEVVYECRRVINCAGAWAPWVAQMLSYPCPSRPVRRQICIFDSRDVDLTDYGMIIDTSGVYFHPEATNGLAGFANPDEPAGINFDYDPDKFFMEVIWPALYERSSKFEQLKHVTGWAGLYEVSPDESAIIGQVKLGDAGRSNAVFEAHSFSGHGAMHSYSAGKALAEKILQGRYQDIDFEPLSGIRFEEKRFFQEQMVI